MGDIEELKQLMVKFRDERDWKQFHNPKDLSISLMLEAAEFLEHFQWRDPAETAEHVKKHKDELSDELSDILSWILLISNDLEIDLTSAFKKKLAKNRAKYPVNKAKGNHKKYTELASE